MTNEQFAKGIASKISQDTDVYDKSGLFRFREIDSDEGKVIRVWKHGAFDADISRKRAAEFILERLEDGKSRQSDFVFQ